MNREIDFSGEPYILTYQNIIYKGPCYHRDALELLFVLRGKLEISIERESSYLKEGEFICINPGDTHMATGDSETYVVSLYLDLNHYEKIHPYIRAFKFYCRCSDDETSDLDRHHALRNYLIRLMTIESLDIPLRCELGTELCDIMVDILINHVNNKTYMKYRLSELKPNDKERLLSMSKFIFENYNQRGFSLSQLAEHEHLSPTRLSHFWKDMTNISFKDTVNTSRYMESKRLLMDGELSINKIVEKCGYSDEKYLYKVIREKYNMTPSEFRKRYKEISSKPNYYTIKNITEIAEDVINYSSNYYNRLNDLSFLDEHPDKIEEENLNELYAIITDANKKKSNSEEILSDYTILRIGIDCGLRHNGSDFDINWEYIYAVGQITTKLISGCSLIVDIELMSPEKWHGILTKIESIAYKKWGNKFKTTSSLIVSYRVYANLSKARAFADEVSREGYFVRVIPILYL